MISLGSKHLLKQETSQLLFTNPSTCCTGVDRRRCIVTATLRWLNLLRLWLMITESRNKKARPQLCQLENKLFRRRNDNPCSLRLRPSSEAGSADGGGASNHSPNCGCRRPSQSCHC